MREIHVSVIRDEVKRLFLEAAYVLPSDVKEGLIQGARDEASDLARSVLRTIAENSTVAAEGAFPLCQDCGMAVVFLDIGQDVRLAGGDLTSAVDEGVRRAYKEGYLRNSVVSDPVFERRNTGDNTPAVLHVRIVPGERVHITAAPKGFGSENMSAVAMLSPASGREGVIDFVVETVRLAGPNACPPVVVGVGVGSDFEGVAALAKRALLRPLGEPNLDERYADLEREILRRINALGIGAAGYGGTVTALSIHVEWAPTHIAGLPVAANICCHANRHVSATV